MEHSFLLGTYRTSAVVRERAARRVNSIVGLDALEGSNHPVLAKSC